MSTEALLEVIVCSVADSVEAQQGGAKRLEIVRDLSRGGLTPPLDLVREITRTVSIPVRVMLRDTDGYSLASKLEKRSLCNAAKELSQLHIDGIVLGFLRGRKVDLELMKEILSIAPKLKVTFHHAFEETDQNKAIQELKKMAQVDRILTHGGLDDLPARIERFKSYQRHALPEIQIIAGGGLDTEQIRAIRGATNLQEFHVGRAARAANSVTGAVSAERVKALVAAIELPDQSLGAECL